MIDAGLLNEVSDIYKPKSNYTRGMKQAIGVREFEEFFRAYSFNNGNIDVPNSVNITHTSKPKFADILYSKDSELRTLLVVAIDKFKTNTRKLVRRQVTFLSLSSHIDENSFSCCNFLPDETRIYSCSTLMMIGLLLFTFLVFAFPKKRRLNLLKTDFSWNMNYIDGTKAFSDEDEAGDSWSAWVLEPCVKIVRTFLLGADLTSNEASDDIHRQRLVSRELCTQYVCEACGNRVLRGTHEWEQHKKGRVHKKRFLRFNKKHLLEQHKDKLC